MSLEDTTFRRNPYQFYTGYELEFLLPEMDELPRIRRYGRFKEDGSVNTLEEDWDSGIADEDTCYKAHEYASYKARGDILLHSITKVCDALTKAGGYTNETCGTHIHIDISQLSAEEKKNIRFWFCTFQSIFFAMTTDQRLARRYCQPIPYKYLQSTYGWESDRYRALNISAEHKYRTYEIRILHGTLDKSVVRNWTMMFLRFFDTFKSITCTEERVREIHAMQPREQLILFFQMIKCPLSLARHIVSQIRAHTGSIRSNRSMFLEALNV